MMVRSSKALNWAIAGYFALDVFGYKAITTAAPTSYPVFILLPIILFLWEACIIFICLSDAGTKKLPPYERIQSGDYWRLFWILLAGQSPLAFKHLWGFYLFTAVTVPLFLLVVVIATAELYRKRTISPRFIGCTLLLCFLFSWEKNAYVTHYGVPIVGHFLEKPEYDARYRVELSLKDADAKYEAIADIHVGVRTESHDDGTDWLGNDKTSVDTVRDIWIKKLYFRNGDSVEVLDQDEPLQFGEPVRVEGADGRSWYVELLREPIF